MAQSAYDRKMEEIGEAAKQRAKEQELTEEDKQFHRDFMYESQDYPGEPDRYRHP